MYNIVEFLLSNFIIILILLIALYIYLTYKSLTEKKAKMKKQFDNYLDKYLGDKINLANDTANLILNEYGREDAVRTEIIRLQVIIKKGIEGSIADKVETANVLNKFKVSKEIDFDKYPHFKDLENISPFHDIDIYSITDDVSIARRQYNLLATEYNEKAGGTPTQYIVKLLGLETQFPVFESIIQEKYSDKYEEFEVVEPEINKITQLNVQTKIEDKPLEHKEGPNANPTPIVHIDYSNETFKPTKDLK
jgi:hypothetical protein